MEIQKESIGKSIEALFDGKAYEEMVNASTALLEKHGMKLLPEGTIGELAEFLYKATDHPRSKSEQIKSVENKAKTLRYATYAGYAAVVLSSVFAGFRLIEPFQMEVERLGNKKAAGIHEAIRLKEQYNSAQMAYDKQWNQSMTLIAMAAILSTVCLALVMEFHHKSRSKKLDKIRGENEPPQRTLKRGIADRIINPKKELFKFAFGLAQHSNIKLIKSPLEAMTKEVTRLVMDARMNGEKSIKEDAVKKGDIKEYLSRLKSVMNKEISRLGKNLDKEIDKIVAKQNKKEKKNDKKEFSDLSEKADFVKKSLIDNETKSPINNEAKVVCDMADKAKFMNEFSKMFNVKSEDVLIDAISNVMVGMSQEMMNKLSAAENVSIEELDPSSLERSIKDAEQEEKKLENTLLESNENLQMIDEENEKIKKEIDDIQIKILDKKKDITESKQAMEETPLGQDQLKVFESELSKLSKAGIDINTKDEYAGYTPGKVKNITGDKERLENLLKEHDKLYDKYSTLEAEKKKREDQLERIEFLETRKPGKDEKIKKIQDDIEEFQIKIDDLKSEDIKLLTKLEKKGVLDEILTPQAINRVKKAHLAQSENDLKEHAQEYGYSSNYKSVGHFLTACLDIHQSLQKDIEDSREPELYGYLVKSDTDIADGMDWQYRKTPISASVANIIAKQTDQGEKKYLIDHVYGYVPRHWHAEK